MAFNHSGTIYVQSEIIDRIMELRERRDDYASDSGAYDEDCDAQRASAWDAWATENPDEAAELRTLEEAVSGIKGYGGDIQHDGDWYPDQLIADGYFKEHAMELAADIAPDVFNAKWPYSCIDWDQAAEELRADYSFTEIDGEIYWYR